MRDFFWMPIQDTTTRPLPDPTVKRLGKQLFKLYGRCSLCDWSGPSEFFSEIQCGDQVALVCSGPNCGGSEHTWRHLIQDDWHPVRVQPRCIIEKRASCTCDEGRGCEQHADEPAF